MQKCWIWLKTNWVIPFSALLIVISYFAGNQGKTSLREMMKAQKDDYETQLRVLEEKRAKERRYLKIIKSL